ncbi:hypothetical protein [Furfurilactobacillus rossiae]|uniref:Uncharacterized protein n=1 Tax=Furfurilactobacillus rossiae DSM 15814 TaxID=1114972 RepID=A0A0R1RLV6_9LACO|nr:hypothetical protein [Furfurilactobacillus rossiae]KRL57241.1 hypothetical protein FD35_GL000251 [Furfurilactobacillus rossiae DSM 15814]QFR65878.1 hypothetical protein LR814_01620 [Furfurilactobacillus rossiae]QLE61290.1 hypothetical protein LROSRS0_1244 [Furfurilactobacillus rossiae]
MTKTKRNMLINTSVWTIILLELLVLTYTRSSINFIGWLLVLFNLTILSMTQANFVPNQHVKLFDLKETGQPLNMLPADEREWHVMQKADYVSTNVTLILLSVPLVTAFMLPKIAQDAADSVIPNLFSLDALSFIIVCLIVLILLVKKWASLFMYVLLEQRN